MTGDLGRTLGWALIVLGVGFGVAGVYLGRSVNADESSAKAAPATEAPKGCPDQALEAKIDEMRKVCEARPPKTQEASPQSAEAGAAAGKDPDHKVRLLAGNLTRFYCECFTKLGKECTERLNGLETIMAEDPSVKLAMDQIGKFKGIDNSKCADLAKNVGGWQ